jgi:hypothetical protein
MIDEPQARASEPRRLLYLSHHVFFSSSFPISICVDKEHVR